jgi:hypothetical protein
MNLLRREDDLAQWYRDNELILWGIFIIITWLVCQ